MRISGKAFGIIPVVVDDNDFYILHWGWYFAWFPLLFLWAIFALLTDRKWQEIPILVPEDEEGSIDA